MSKPMNKIAFALAACFALNAPLALAQTQGATATEPETVAAGPVRAQHTVTYAKQTNYDFDADTVEGVLNRPDGDLVTTRSRAPHPSMIKARANFRPEMLKSVESL